MGPLVCAICTLTRWSICLAPHNDLLMFQYLKMPVPLQLLIFFRTVSSISTGNNTHTDNTQAFPAENITTSLCTALDCRCVPAHLVCAALSSEQLPQGSVHHRQTRPSVVLPAPFLCSFSQIFPTDYNFFIFYFIYLPFFWNRVLMCSLVWTKLTILLP